MLARAVEELTLLEVINAVEPVQRIRTCPLKIGTHGSRLCALHQALDDAMATVERSLSGQTVAQLLERNTGSTPLCEVTPNGTSSVQQLSISVRKPGAPRSGPG